jgi:hypothetical protein
MNEYFAFGETYYLDNAGLSKLEVAEVACSQEPALVNA